MLRMLSAKIHGRYERGDGLQAVTDIADRGLNRRSAAAELIKAKRNQRDQDNRHAEPHALIGHFAMHWSPRT